MGDVVGQMRAPALRNPADLKLPDRDAAVRAVQMGVQTGARPQHQHLFLRIQSPDAGESRIEMAHEQLAAAAEAGLQSLVRGKQSCYLGAKTGEGGAFGEFRFSRFSLGDVANKPDKQSFAFALQGTDRQLRRKLSTIAPHRGQLQTPTEHRTRPGREIVRQPFVDALHGAAPE